MPEAALADGPGFFGYRIRVLRLVGCCSFIRDESSTLENFYIFLASSSLVNSFLGVLLSFYTLATFIAVREDIEKICGQAITFIIAFQVFSKSGLMFVKCHQLQRLIRDLNVNLHASFVCKPKDREIMRKCYEYDVKLSIFFCVFSTFVTVANIVKPLIVTLSYRSKQSLNGTDAGRIGEFPSKYPFELEANSFWYAFWFAQQVMVVLPGGIASWVSDSMFCAFLYYICGHFDILMNNIRSGGSDVDGREIASHHNQLIRFAKETVAVFGPIMVIQLLLAAITICCLLFQFVSVKGELVLYSRPLTYLTLKLIQIYIMCWHGQLLLDKSTELGQALYFSPWYERCKLSSSDLKILILRTQVPVRVLYGAIFQLSAGTFAQILNAAYGYFAMMSKMKKS